MHNFKLKWSCILLGILTTFSFTGFSEGIFLTGWIFPKPTEVVIIGLFFLKVIGMQLAVAHGFLMPPHNPYFGKRSISSPHFTRTPKNSTMKIITIDEFNTIERVLLSLRRIDTKDCFLRSVCEMNQDLVTGKDTSNSKKSKLLEVFRLRKLLKVKPKSGSVWDIYEEATRSEKMNCTTKFLNCPLSRKELQYEKILSTLL